MRGAPLQCWLRVLGLAPKPDRSAAHSDDFGRNRPLSVGLPARLGRVRIGYAPFSPRGAPSSEKPVVTMRKAGDIVNRFVPTFGLD